MSETYTVVGIKNKHNKVFGKCVRSLGLEGKLTATQGGEAFWTWATSVAKELGTYPHAQLNPNGRPVKKQTTRLVKAECDACGCNVRITRKWLDEVGAPLCACNNRPMKFTIPDELEGGEDE